MSNPGKFEGEPAHTEYLWNLCMAGIGHVVYCAEEQFYNVVLLEEEDYRQHESLRGWEFALLDEDEQGFVTCQLTNKNPEDG
jgi:hypothetical protein